MYVIIAGCGRVGARLATDMASDGHNVVVIDRDRSSFQNLGTAFNGLTVVGNTIDEDVLRDAGIERADAFAATTSFDNVNIMAAQIAQSIFGVPKVAARVIDPGREALFRDLGLNPICGTNLAAGHLYSILLSEGIHHRSSVSAGEIAEVEVVLEDRHEGLSLDELEIGGEFRAFAVQRDGEAFIPGNDYRSREGDRLFCAVRATALEDVERRFRQKTKR